MRYRFLISTIIAFALSSATAFAQSDYDSYDYRVNANYARQTVNKALANQQPRVTTEFGLGIGARYNFFDVIDMKGAFSPNITMNLSYGAALQFRLNIGRTFGIQPEISYAYSTVKLKGGEIGSTIKAKSNLVQIPFLLSFRIAIVRINFGPVFTVMDNPSYMLPDLTEDSIKTCYLGNLYPAVTYAAGLSFKLPKNMMIDVRYADQFKDIKKVNEFLWTLDANKQSEPITFRTRTRSVQLRFGLVF